MAISEYEDARQWYIEKAQVINKMSRATNDFGVGIMQYCILDIMSKRKYETPMHLAKEAKMTDSSASRAINSLHQKGLIDRLIYEFDDTRKIKIVLTPHGKKLVRKINRVLNAEFPSYLDDMM